MRYNHGGGEMSYECELWHYGVKGMRWGVRRSREQKDDPSKKQSFFLDRVRNTPSKTYRYVASKKGSIQKGANAVATSLVKIGGAGVGALVGGATTGLIGGVGAGIAGGLTLGPAGAAIGSVAGLAVGAVNGAPRGAVGGIRVSKRLIDEFEHKDGIKMESSNDDYLVHYGILGMKWGIRRTPEELGHNPSGKRRPASELSDEELSSTIKRRKLEKQYDGLDDETDPVKVIQSTKDSITKLKNINDAGIEKIKKSKIPVDVSDMSDEELRKSIARAKLEREYNDYFAKSPEVSAGRKFVTAMLDGAESMVSIALPVTMLAVAIKKLRK